jgi:adenylylsulfate kinase
MITILVMGLPDSGKSTFAARLRTQLEGHDLSVTWYNADALRMQHNDWDFSPEGRLRQAHRMKGAAANEHTVKTDVCILDFVCPDPSYRQIVDPDIIVCLATRETSVYENTNAAFKRVSIEEAMSLDAALYHVTSFEEEDRVLVRVTSNALSLLDQPVPTRPGLVRRLISAFRGA